MKSLIVLCACAAVAAAQTTPARVSVRVSSAGLPLAHAIVRAADRAAETNAVGLARLSLDAGRHRVRVTLLGYAPESTTVDLGTRDTVIAVELSPIAAELSGIVVTSARGAQRIESEPLRVEVLAGEDVAEKTEMRPNDMRNFLAEMAGIRVQQLSAATGAASVRMQGLRPRYTLLLADGLPLYGSSSGGFDLLQLPPADLRQIEVVKGPASALYGPSALGGMINLVSKRPGHESDLLVHGTSERGANAFGWTSRRISDAFGYTAVVGAHSQEMRDMDGDGWVDLPEVRRVEARPRFFRDWPGGHSLFVTVGGTAENREGGFAPGRRAPDGTRYLETVNTRRGDLGVVGHRLVGSHGLLQLRAAGNVDDKHRTYGTAPENVRRSTGFGELSFSNALGAHDLLGGGAVEREAASLDAVALDDFTTTSAFAQDAWHITPAWSTTTSARVDHHPKFGTLFSPRLSLLRQLTRGWTARVSGTRGFYAPTPFVEEVEAVGVRRATGFDALRAETAEYGAVDVSGHTGPVELNGTLFASRVHHQVIAEPDDITGRMVLANAAAEATSRGAELFAVYDREPLFVTALYTYTDAIEPAGFRTSATHQAPYVPRHTGGIDVTWEDDDSGTWIAVEAFYTGTQSLDRDPYRAAGHPYTTLGILATQRIGRYKLFANVENLGNVRQTRYAPLILPSQRNTGEWTTNVWGPLEGRVFSVGLRVSGGELVR